jgi:hypothetical protein
MITVLTLCAFQYRVCFAWDDTMRCNGRLVVIGDAASEVMDTCGEPDEIERREENHRSFISQIYDYELKRYILPKLIKGPILMEQWTYNFGSNRLIRHLHFENGKLIKIETGEKVYD